MRAILLRPLPAILLVLAAVAAQAQGSGPQLVLHGDQETSVGVPVFVPVELIKNGHDVTAVVFSLEIDLDRLGFDPADSDEDGIPDDVIFPLGEPELVYVVFEADGDDGRLDVMLANLSGLPLLDGVLLEVELLPAASGWVASWIHFSLDPPPSFGGADGLDIPGTWVVLGAELFADGFESGGLGAWSSVSP